MSATVLLSGGMDSTVLLHYVAKREGDIPVFALSFDYGQRHSRELEMARWQAQRVAEVAEHRVVEAGWLGDLLGSSSALLRKGAPVPDLADIGAGELRQPPTYVPNRNLILLAAAAAYAESRGCSRVYYGAQAHDRYGYWDCTTEFVERTNQVLQLNRSSPVTIMAPFAELRKSQEIALGTELGVDFARTWSCYRGGVSPCGTCPTCVEREQAFEEAGIRDPLRTD